MRKCKLCRELGHLRTTCRFNRDNVPWTVTHFCYSKKQATVYTILAPTAQLALSRARVRYGVHVDYCAVAPVS